MTLKIEFQSDIRGFERVQKVLEENQKALNANADALARLNKEQTALGNGAMDFKGIDSIKNASDAVQKLAKSFDQVMSNQGGMRGFLTTFSRFRKEIGEINKEQGLSILDTMSKQMETLKGNVTTSMDSLKKLRRELKDVDPSQPSFVRDYKQTKYNEAAEFVSVNNELLNKLIIQKMIRQPLLQGPESMFGQQLPGGIGGGMAGFIGGGTNLMRLGSLGGQLAAGAVAANFASKWGLNAMYTDERANNMDYFMQKQVYDSAQSGNIGRNYLRENQVGREGRLLKNINEGDGSFFGTKMGDSTLESILSKTTMGISALFTAIKTGTLPSATRMLTERQQQLAELDSARSDAISTAASRTKSTITGGSFMGLEAGRGFDYVRGLQRTVASRNLSLEEAAPALYEARRFGVEEYAARSGLAKNANETGITDRARTEIFRQQSYGGVGRGGAYNSYGKILSVAGASGIDTSNMSYREAISDVIAQRTMNIAGQVDAGSVNAPFQQALTTMSANNVQLSVPEKISAASNVQNMVQGRMGQTGTMESMGTDFALIELGVKEAPVRAQITQLISAGNTDKAVQYIANLTGKSEATIRSRLNLAKTQADAARKTIFFGSEENAARVEKAAKAAGLSATGAIMSGNANGVLGVAGMTETIEGALPIADDMSKSRKGTPIPKDTTGRQIQGAEARQTEAYMQMTTKLSATATDEAGKLVEVFSGFLSRYRSEIQSKLDEVSNEIKQRSLEQTPMYQNMMKFKEENQSIRTPAGQVKGTNLRDKL